MAAPRTPGAAAGFDRAVAGLRRARLRPEVVISEAPSPSRLAPHSLALDAEVRVDGTELATGRLVVLHDPDGQDAWEGTTRLVGYLRAPLEPEMGSDPLLPSVGWAWLIDALAAAGAGHTAAGGTVTRVSSERFGALAGRADAAEIELRASWTPLEEDLGPHLRGFAELLCTAAGLPPAVPGVVAMPRRARRPSGR